MNYENRVRLLDVTDIFLTSIVKDLKGKQPYKDCECESSYSWVNPKLTFFQQNNGMGWERREGKEREEKSY